MVGAAYAAVPLYNCSAAPPALPARPRSRARARSTCSAARSPSASMPMSRPACRGNSSRSRTRSSCASARWRPSTTRSSTKPRARSPRRPPTTSRRRRSAPISTRSTASASPSRRMKPGETREMTVVFYVDPEIVKDRDQDRAQHHHAVLYLLPAARRRAAGGGSAGQEFEQALTGIGGAGGAVPKEVNGDDDGRGSRQTITTTTWSIRARGRWSAPSRRFLMAFGAIALDASYVRRGAAGVRARRRRHPLYLHRLVARRDPRSPVRGLPHPRGADLAPLRHDPVHRLRGDVLRRLVLGLFQHRAVSRRRARCRAHGHHPRRLAAAGHRDLRSLASAAAQHADPAHLRHHGDLGASRAAWRTTARG